MDKILEAKNLSKVFGESENDQVKVLRGIDLQINQGEFVAIMGRSGSGKSTLLYNISGMDDLTSGEVIFAGQDISGLSDKEISSLRLHKMGFIFQHSHLLKFLSVKENIMLPALKAAKFPKDKISEEANSLMKQVGIEEVGDNDITEISGGQLQRGAICRALINRPDIIFGDEPTGALNSSASQEILNILNEINSQGTTLLIVTHDIKVATRAEKIIYLSDGKIKAEYNAGKYNKEDDSLEARENEINNWLKSNGF
ncbi:MAG: ABC transporter ATP-binding protein [Bacillota bacterium]